MAAAVDMLEVEAGLEAAAAAAVETAPAGWGARESSDAGMQAAPASSDGGEGFHSSGKGSTWKKFKKMVQHKKGGNESILAAAGASERGRAGGSASSGGAGPQGLPIDPAAPHCSHTQSHSHTSSQLMAGAMGCGDGDAASEVAPSELLGRGSRLSMRTEGAGWEVGTEDGGDSRRGTLKGMFKKQKKSKQIELDALRFEMGQLQERHDVAERDLASVRHDIGQLSAERDHLANQVHELTNGLSLCRSELASTEAERLRLKELHSQVKAALQESYGQQQEQRKQVKELEDLCAAQQNSLEEGEERYRRLQEQQDALHHAALAAKAQLVTAQAQLSEARSQREELSAELGSLTAQVAGLQAEIDSRDEKMGGLEAAAEQANQGLESALARLRELERDQQALEGRLADVQEENLELSTELSGVTELRRQLEGQLQEAQSSSASLATQVASLAAALEASRSNEASLAARLAEVTGQLASSSEAAGGLRAQNGELLAELQAAREQQQQASKPSSPLSKWHKPKPPASSSTAAAGGAVPASSGSGGSASGGHGSTAAAGSAAAAAAAAVMAAAGSGSGGGCAAGFSPMTSQLPAVRASALASGAHPAQGDAVAQAPSSGDGTPSHADSSCVVIAGGSGSEAGGTLGLADAAATAPGGGDTLSTSLSASLAGPLLKPPVSSSSPDIGLIAAKGPLTAARPQGGGRRPPPTAGAGGGGAGAPAGALQLGRQSGEGGGAAKRPLFGAPGAAQRKLTFGLGDAGQPGAVGQGGGGGGGQPGDFLSKVFGCFTPRVAEVV